MAQLSINIMATRKDLSIPTKNLVVVMTCDYAPKVIMTDVLAQRVIAEDLGFFRDFTMHGQATTRAIEIRVAHQTGALFLNEGDIIVPKAYFDKK
jgi:hypothetical protein